MGSLQRDASWLFLRPHRPVRFAISAHESIRALTLTVAIWAALTTTAAAAAEYPTRPIRLIVASAPGGQPDINARMFAAELGKQMRQQVVVDNRVGASGSIGYEMLARAPPDGYTLSYVSFILSTNPSMLPNLPYDAARDMQMVILTHISPNILGVATELPVRSVAELISHAKQNPGKLMYGSSGIGSSQHLSMELFKLMTGTQLIHVPYKGIQQAITEVIGGHLHMVCDNAFSIMPHLAAGRLRGLGVTGTRRIPAVPDLPPIAEAGSGIRDYALGRLCRACGYAKTDRGEAQHGAQQDCGFAVGQGALDCGGHRSGGRDARVFYGTPPQGNREMG